MIASLRGKVSEVGTETAVIDVNGVGYEVCMTLDGLSQLQAYMGKEVSVTTHTHVREDALQLFGFVSKLEKQLFLSLIKVSGIGPRMAVHLLSGAPTAQIMSMIEAEDVKGLSKLPRVGKKTAEQIILALKGKLVLAESTSESTPKVSKEITSALLNLGFRAADVEKALSKLPPNLDLQEGVRQGLLALTTL